MKECLEYLESLKVITYGEIVSRLKKLSNSGDNCDGCLDEKQCQRLCNKFNKAFHHVVKK